MVSQTGPRLALIKGSKEFLATYTIGGEIPRNADISFINAYYLSHFAGLVIARSMNTTASAGLLFKRNNEIPEEVIYKDGVMLTKQTDISVAVEDDPDKWSFVLNNYLFFKGNYSEIEKDQDYKPYTQIQVEDFYDVADSISNWKECTATFSGDVLKIKHGIFVELVTDESEARNLNRGIEVEIGDAINLIENPEDWLFSVYSESAQASYVYGAGIKIKQGDNSKNFEFTVEYPDPEGSKKETYYVSLFTEANDSNGAKSYIDNLNAMPNFQFKVEVFNPEIMPIATPQLVPFGVSGLDLITSKKPSNLKLATNVLEDQEIYDIEYLAPVGITNLAFLKRFTQLGKVKNWFTPVDVPRDRTNANSIQMYFREIDDSSNVYCCGPFDKNSGLTGWVNFIACSTLYYEKLMNNKAQNAEFAPIFDREFGTLQMINPTFQLGISDREKLLSYGSPVNFVKYDQRLDLFYMNNNLTHQSVDDVLSEEQNRRLVNKIKKDLMRLAGQFKSKYNTPTTRALVISIIAFYFQNNIMNKQFPPDAYNIICDESNNSPEDIRANKLGITVQIRLYNSIKYITVFHEIFPIGVNWNS
jgi:hypothetical protein